MFLSQHRLKIHTQYRKHGQNELRVVYRMLKTKDKEQLRKCIEGQHHLRNAASLGQLVCL